MYHYYDIVSMPIIQPISDLRNNFSEISEKCHREGQPIFITKNGKGDLVVMSLAKYEQMEARLELYQKLGEAQFESLSGGKRYTHQEIMDRLRQKINDKTP